ncbi:hypothetical protein [uncultured Roseobacter sp.]|uniref:hypothetical protein n=1 Tax=uncultured Roseobacter sp. TaxID=114847 RepID=UPI00260E0C9E|nr:hypothetical protein [uncultured Roseobacter sp.]
MDNQKSKEEPRSRLVSFLDFLGRLTLIYSIFATIAKLDEVDQIMELAKSIFVELRDILNFVDTVLHYALVPWNAVSYTFYYLLPFNIPDSLRDPLLICALMYWWPKLVWKTLVSTLAVTTVKSGLLRTAKLVRRNHNFRDKKEIATAIGEEINKSNNQLLGLGPISDYMRALRGTMVEPWLSARKRSAMSSLRGSYDVANSSQREIEENWSRTRRQRKWSSRIALVVLISIFLKQLTDQEVLSAFVFFALAISFIFLGWFISAIAGIILFGSFFLVGILITALAYLIARFLDILTGGRLRAKDFLSQKILGFQFRNVWSSWEKNTPKLGDTLFDPGDCRLKLVPDPDPTLGQLLLLLHEGDFSYSLIERAEYNLESRTLKMIDRAGRLHIVRPNEIDSLESFESLPQTLIFSFVPPASNRIQDHSEVPIIFN